MAEKDAESVSARLLRPVFIPEADLMIHTKAKLWKK